MTGHHADLKAVIETLPNLPGIYRFCDADGTVIYVGKARQLRKRVSSYFKAGHGSAKTRALVARTAGIDVVVTHSESEALLLENNLIKELKPKYNVLLRDDKSYPYIFLSKEDRFPRLAFHRGARTEKGRYFGPYPNAGAVRESLQLIQKVFPVRQCEDSFFRNRSRPCLQYQIKRCTAPCVGYISAEAYQEDVAHAEMFLEGKSREVIERLVERMELAARSLQYEQAARYRDQIASLQRLQEKQWVQGERGEMDLVVCRSAQGAACVVLFMIRGGRNLGHKCFFPDHVQDASVEQVLNAFLAQYYLGKAPPEVIAVDPWSAEADLLAEVLTEQSGRPVTIQAARRGRQSRWLQLAQTNADHALSVHLSSRQSVQARFCALRDELALAEMPERVECFDISHTMGEATVASCVVFGQEGPLKSDYRRFNIEGLVPGDDYGALHQALTRRYRRLKESGKPLPDLLLIDGGKGQLAEAVKVLAELQIDGVQLMAVAKGPERRPGRETLHLHGSDRTLELPPTSLALHLIQQIRDEAHRFAITGHRQRRQKARRGSPLEAIPGLGPKRRRALLTYFGGVHSIFRAGVEDLAGVPGISRQLAQRIYEYLHDD